MTRQDEIDLARGKYERLLTEYYKLGQQQRTLAGKLETILSHISQKDIIEISPAFQYRLLNIQQAHEIIDSIHDIQEELKRLQDEINGQAQTCKTPKLGFAAAIV
jgi:hypothetical protein